LCAQLLYIQVSQTKATHATAEEAKLRNHMTNPTHFTTDNSHKSILARGCDPHASLQASRAIPPLIGNPEYVPTTNDDEFVEQLQSRAWSVVFFAPGACRFSAANSPIPGSSTQTKGWSLDEYRELVHSHQGDGIQIVEALDERETVTLLEQALRNAPDTTESAVGA
jgi:hypothetical protein